MADRGGTYTNSGVSDILPTNPGYLACGVLPWLWHWCDFLWLFTASTVRRAACGQNPLYSDQRWAKISSLVGCGCTNRTSDYDAAGAACTLVLTRTWAAVVRDPAAAALAVVGGSAASSVAEAAYAWLAPWLAEFPSAGLFQLLVPQFCCRGPQGEKQAGLFALLDYISVSV